jgi:predicted dehydrogenase
MNQGEGLSYAPQGLPRAVVAPDEFRFAAVALDHGHIYGMCRGLIAAGASLRWVYDPDPQQVAAFRQRFPEARPARSLDEILDDRSIALVAAAAVPNLRGPLGVRVMQAGKDYFTDKCPFTSLAQLAEARAAVAATGRKYMVYYSERLHVESAVYAGELIAQGAIGRVIQVLGLGPHRLSAGKRPAWFFKKAQYGGILCDIGSHQVEQFLFYSGAGDATIRMAAVANYNHPQYPELEDFGELSLLGDNGASGYARVDWFTPDGLRSWGDGRMLILGTNGSIELRKYLDVGRDPTGDQVYLVNDSGEEHLQVRGQVGFPFFGRLIRDCLGRTELAMTQTHAFKAAELSLQAQAQAELVRGDNQAQA